MSKASSRAEAASVLVVFSGLNLGEINRRTTVEPVREHLEQVLWARLEELIEKK
ncbi:MAG: hypothetical protein ABMA26_21965 [Limisphaerales bacterium]